MHRPGASCLSHCPWAIPRGEGADPPHLPYPLLPPIMSPSPCAFLAWTSDALARLEALYPAVECGRYPEQHTAGAPDLFISTLWTFTSQRQRWPMTILGAAALSGINTRGHGSLKQGSSSDSEDQERLLREGGLGSKGRSSAAARSMSPYPLRLHESSLPLIPEKSK